MNDTTQPGDPLSDDDLRARLRAADPAGPGTRVADRADSWIDDLTEATMSKPDTVQSTAPRPRRTSVAIGAAAAVVLAAAGIGTIASRGDSPRPAVAQPTKVMTLGLPAGNAGASCIRFSVDVLRPMDIALSATATQVATDSVTLTPDHWYKGADGSNTVTLTTFDHAAVLEGAVTFEQGKRYLITATGGTVNGCGFSGEWTAEMAAAFAQAFGG